MDWVKSGDSSLLSDDKLTKILNDCTPLRENYEKLVPDSVSHADFWYRFLFRKALLEDEDAKQQRRLEKEKQEAERIDFNKGRLLLLNMYFIAELVYSAVNYDL